MYGFRKPSPKQMTFVDQNRLKGNHVQAVFSTWLSRACLVRPVADGTDIGVDLYCESILDGQPFLHFWAQVKTLPTANIITKDGRPTASFRFERRHLIYWQRQPIPVYAFLVPIDAWPPATPDKVFGVRITEHLVRNGLPSSETIKLETANCFGATSLDEDLRQFITKIVPWDSAALLMRRGIVAPIPSSSDNPE